MNKNEILTKIRQRATATIQSHGISIKCFSRKTGLNYEWLYRFLNGSLNNPTIDSLANRDNTVTRFNLMERKKNPHWTGTPNEGEN